MIFTDSYIDLVQISANVRIKIWQPNRFVHDLAPLFVILVVKLSFSSQHRSPHIRQMPPNATNKTKKWGEPDRDHLYELIQTGQVDIGDLSHENIEAVRQEHFRHHNIRNFCQHFKDFSAAFDLEAEYRGARRNRGGEGKLRRMVLIIICVRVLESYVPLPQHMYFRRRS